jgi:hypothetical protein
MGKGKKSDAAAAAAKTAAAADSTRSNILASQPFVQSLNESTLMFNELFARVAPTRKIPYRVLKSSCVDPATLTIEQCEAVKHLSGYLSTANKCIESYKVASLPEYSLLLEMRSKNKESILVQGSGSKAEVEIDSPESNQRKIMKEVESHLTKNIRATTELERKVLAKNAEVERETAELQEISEMTLHEIFIEISVLCFLCST